MYRLSIIVPLLRDVAPFEDTLVSVLQNRPRDSEVLVVHRGPYEDPYELRKEDVHFVAVREDAALIETLDAACVAAGGEVLHVLQPGVLVEEGWTEPALPWFDDPHVGSVSPVIVDRDAPERILAAGVCYTRGGRRCLNGTGLRLDKAPRSLRPMIVGPTLRAAFYRKSALEALAGLEQCGGNLWADVDLALSLQALGFSCVLEPRCTVRGRFAEDSVTAFEHGRCAESVFWKHAGLNGWAPSLLCHPLVVLGSLIFPWNGPPGGRQLLGRLAALARLFGHLSNAARLRQTANFFRRGPSGVRRAPSGHGAEDGAGPPRLSVCRHQRAA